MDKPDTLSCHSSGPWVLFNAFSTIFPTATADSVHSALDGAAFGEGFGKIWVDNVGCTGTEAALDECAFDFDLSVDGDCDHSKDASVQCNRRKS